MTVGQRAGVDTGILPEADGCTAAVGCFHVSGDSALPLVLRSRPLQSLGIAEMPAFSCPQEQFWLM